MTVNSTNNQYVEFDSGKIVIGATSLAFGVLGLRSVYLCSKSTFRALFGDTPLQERVDLLIKEFFNFTNYRQAIFGILDSSKRIKELKTAVWHLGIASINTFVIYLLYTEFAPNMTEMSDKAKMQEKKCFESQQDFIALYSTAKNSYETWTTINCKWIEENNKDPNETLRCLMTKNLYPKLTCSWQQQEEAEKAYRCFYQPSSQPIAPSESEQAKQESVLKARGDSDLVELDRDNTAIILRCHQDKSNIETLGHFSSLTSGLLVNQLQNLALKLERYEDDCDKSLRYRREFLTQGSNIFGVKINFEKFVCDHFDTASNQDMKEACENYKKAKIFLDQAGIHKKALPDMTLSCNLNGKVKPLSQENLQKTQKVLTNQENAIIDQIGQNSGPSEITQS